MAHLRKKSYTKPIPESAEILERNGRRFARFRSRGRLVEAPVSKDGRRIRLRTRKWYGEYRDAYGWKSVPLFTDREASQQKLAELVKKAAHDQTELTLPFEAHHKRPIREHLEDYGRYLTAEGNCREHVKKTVARVRAILDGCGIAFIPGIAAEKVAEFLHALRGPRPKTPLPAEKDEFTPREMKAALGGVRPAQLARLLRRERLEATGNGKARRYPRATVEALRELTSRGIGISTSNGYLAAFKGFSRWLVERNRTDKDRLASLSLLNADTDVRHERRALTEGELRAILTAAGSSPTVFQGLSGPDRLMLYATAMVTGFRASELASVSPRSLDLDSALGTVRVKAAFSKNRRESVQPLPPEAAQALRRYLDGRPPNRAVWPGKWYKDAAEMLRIDLEAAGIPYRDEEGRVADFHALRHSYISLLSRSGVSPKLAQDLARHSDIRLTMNVYTHTRLYDLAGAVESLPSILPDVDRPEATRLAATGTNSLRLACPVAVNEIGTTPQSMRADESNCPEAPECPSARESVGVTTRRIDCGRMREDERKLPRQDSNLDKENQNLLCYRYTTG